ncbi:hypothetical protein RI129_009537 [Pyrocoelia pectoralis]|uniref:CHK kinase-like domain-containing protein n=1 Tax=Pyrocoelia pectoralis TaxID=417401 RepID=A0AAN7V2C1_9COLE
MASEYQIISKKSLKAVFDDYFKQNVEIANFKSTQLTSDGDNFCSELKRISVSYSLQDEAKKRRFSLIAKYLPQNEYQAQFIEEMKFFYFEQKMYSQIIPKLNQLDYSLKFAPELYYSSQKPIPMLLLEDLSRLNYKVVTGGNLDFNHSLLVIEKLAYLHAASYALHEQNPTVFKGLNQFILRKTDIMAKLLTTCYDEVLIACNDIPELQKYVCKLKVARDHILNKVYNIHFMNSNLKVLNHGDCWRNNVLFHYSKEGEPVDAIFIDFQNPCFASPCLDLQYFLATSVTLEVKSKYSVILDHYFNSLLKYLDKLHLNAMPKREEFYEDFRSTAHLGFASSIFLLPITKAGKMKGASVENFLESREEGSYRHYCFSNEEYRKEMMYYLPFFDKFGIFDI